MLVCGSEEVDFAALRQRHEEIMSRHSDTMDNFRKVRPACRSMGVVHDWRVGMCCWLWRVSPLVCPPRSLLPTTIV